MKRKEGLDKSPSFLYYIPMIRPRSLLEWSNVFGIEVEDLDGFPNLKSNGGIDTTPISLDTFVQGISFCCVGFKDIKRYEVLDELIR
jgi:hypothetical protein